MRAFIAIELPVNIQNELGEVQKVLKSSKADVKWVQPENIHLTLKFLGNINEQKTKEVKEVLDKVAKTGIPFEIKLEGLGAFPKPAFPRVIWIGVKDGGRNTINLANKIEDGLATIGFEKEKRSFSPHLTLGRLRSPKNKNELSALLFSTKFKSSSGIKVACLSLIQSTLTPTGAVYNLLYQAALRRPS